MFQALTGTFGWDPEESCSLNPETLSFSHGNSRIRLDWAQPVPSYLEEGMISFLEGTIVASDDTSVTYLRDGETRRDDAGELLLWTLRLTGDDGGFCVSNPGLPGDCLFHFTPCTPQPNV